MIFSAIKRVNSSMMFVKAIDLAASKRYRESLDRILKINANKNSNIETACLECLLYFRLGENEKLIELIKYLEKKWLHIKYYDEKNKIYLKLYLFYIYVSSCAEVGKLDRFFLDGRIKEIDFKTIPNHILKKFPLPYGYEESLHQYNA